MHRFIRKSLCVASGLCVLATGSVPPVTYGANPFRRQRTSVESLAETIDKVERSLQYHGRVTVKAPDVWGQARLTRHRQEFETQMAQQIDAFPADSLQAEISVSDQAFLSEALSIAAASRSNTNDPAPETAGPTLQIANLNGLLPSATVGDATSVPAGTTSAATSATIVRTQPIQELTTTFTPTKLSLEPEIVLDQRKRFLDHLHEIRRINEGDDTVDAPGYALNLVRIPVSIIPGNKTRENYGAEVTVTAESHVTDELLVPTFRELVINDLVDLLAFPIVKAVNGAWDSLKTAENTLNGIEQVNSAARQHTTSDGAWTKTGKEDAKAQLSRAGISAEVQALIDKPDQSNAGTSPDEPNNLNALQRKMNAIKEQIFDVVKHQIPVDNSSVLTSRDRRSRYPIPASQLKHVIGDTEFSHIVLAAFLARDRNQCRDQLHLPDVQAFLRNELQAAYDFLNSTGVPVKFQDCELIAPPSPMSFPALDEGAAVEQAGLRTATAVDATPLCSIWDSNLVPSVAAIRRSEKAVSTAREQMFVGLHSRSKFASNAIEALAWSVLVESVLLNEKLNKDIEHVSQDPNCHCLPAGQTLNFYGDHPDPAAKQAFAGYVKCRWPIRVFALDPVTQQQNVADTVSLRREMQVALALSFQRRFVNTQSLTRYMRRVEQDIRTISLNNTVVGFSSGDDTFGWRFFPRVQTPDIEPNLTVIGRDLIIGGPNRDDRLRKHRMEPGMRECVALVVMPSFIRHVRFDVRTNWFPLVPKHLGKLVHVGLTPPGMQKTVEWSKLIRSMEDSVACCVKDEHLYRNGEVERLLKRSHQLFARASH